MIINGEWMSGSEIIDLLSQLTADKKRLERQLERTVKRGKWLKRMSTSSSLKCSVCGNNHECPTTFCPNCGADMRGDKNNA